LEKKKREKINVARSSAKKNRLTKKTTKSILFESGKDNGYRNGYFM